MSNINSEYTKSLVSSFYDCDGGNPNYPIWFCGIEHGGDYDKNKTEIFDAYLENKNFDTPTSWADEDYQDSITAAGNFNRYIAAFYSNYENIIFHSLKNDVAVEFVRNNGILHPNGIGFKINLLPFRKRSLDSNSITELNNLMDGDYLTEVLSARRKFFFKQIQKYQTKLVICSGITLINDFYKFFSKNPLGDIPLSQSYTIVRKNGKTKEISYYEFPSIENCKILVIPFLGKQSGFNGYKEVSQFAELIQSRNLG